MLPVRGGLSEPEPHGRQRRHTQILQCVSAWRVGDRVWIEHFLKHFHHDAVTRWIIAIIAYMFVDFPLRPTVGDVLVT